MVKLWSLLFFVFIFLALPRVSFSQNSEISLKEQVFKSRLEEAITARYKERLKVVIPNTEFGIAVNVRLERKQISGDVVNPFNPSSVPDELSLGILNADPVLNQWQPPAIDGDNLVLKKIAVVVSLPNEITEDSKKEVETWLQKNLSEDFGKLAISKVFVAPKLAQKPKEQEPPRALSWEEKFGYFQNALGFSLLGLMFFIGLLFYKFAPSRDMKEMVAMNIRIQELKNASQQTHNITTKRADKPKENEGEGSDNAAATFYKSIQDNNSKLAQLSQSEPKLFESAIKLWSAEGSEGKKKIAVLLDSVLSTINPQQGTATVPFRSISLDILETLKGDKELPEIFNEISLYRLRDKAALVEKVYWELLAVKTIGDKSLQKPFASMSSVSTGQLQKIFRQPDHRVTGLALYFMSDEKRQEVMDELPKEEKKNLVKVLLGAPLVSETELVELENSFNKMIETEETVAMDVINIKEAAPNFIGSMSPLEEVEFINELVSENQEQVLELKQEYPALIFIGEWPKEKLKLLLQGASNNELVALVQTIPNIKDLILGNLPPRVKAIVSDEASKRTLAAEEMEAALGQVREKIFGLIESGQVDLRKLFPKTDSKVEKVA